MEVHSDQNLGAAVTREQTQVRQHMVNQKQVGLNLLSVAWTSVFPATLMMWTDGVVGQTLPQPRVALRDQASAHHLQRMVEFRLYFVTQNLTLKRGGSDNTVSAFVKTNFNNVAFYVETFKPDNASRWPTPQSFSALRATWHLIRFRSHPQNFDSLTNIV